VELIVKPMVEKGFLITGQFHWQVLGWHRCSS
jgi:hypothetical protein